MIMFCMEISWFEFGTVLFHLSYRLTTLSSAKFEDRIVAGGVDKNTQ
jgi:hypothetical protein